MPTKQTNDSAEAIARREARWETVRRRILKLLAFLGGRYMDYQELGPGGRLGCRLVDLTDHPDRISRVAYRRVSIGTKLPFLFKPRERFWLRHLTAYLAARRVTDRTDPAACAIARAYALEDCKASVIGLVGCLLARDATVPKVAAALELDPLVVEAFRVVFFNQRSRRRARVEDSVRFVIHMPPRLPEHREIIDAGLNGTLAEVAAKALALKPAYPDLDLDSLRGCPYLPPQPALSGGSAS